MVMPLALILSKKCLLIYEQNNLHTSLAKNIP
jgi:hypothetical protein